MAESAARSLIRLVVTVAILGAVYLFILKPILDTTNDAFDSVSPAFESLGTLQEEIRDSFDDADFSAPPAFEQPRSVGRAERLLACVQRADGEADRLQRCTRRYGS